MKPKDYYGILGVPETATQEEIKKEYRRIARESHPDRNPGNPKAEERFKEASEAYDILGDEEKRRKFDALRRYGYGTESPGGRGFEGFPWDMPGGSRIRFETGNLQDMDFADLFSADSPFAEVFEQMIRQMGVPPGAGHARPRTRVHRRRGPGGTTANGKTRVAPDDHFFRTEGLDVHCTVWLKLEQLQNGARVRVRTPAGNRAIVKVPAGTEIGAVLRLPGLGLSDGARRGDQYVHVEAVA